MSKRQAQSLRYFDVRVTQHAEHVTDRKISIDYKISKLTLLP